MKKVGFRLHISLPWWVRSVILPSVILGLIFGYKIGLGSLLLLGLSLLIIKFWIKDNNL